MNKRLPILYLALGFRRKVIYRHSRESGNPESGYESLLSGFLPAQE